MSEEKKETVVEEQVEETTEVVNPNPVIEDTAQKTDTQEEAPKEETAEVKEEEAVEEKKEEAEKVEEPQKDETATDDFEEIVVDINDLEEENEYPDAEMETLTRLYDQTMSKISEGEIVNGRILNITDNGVIIDIGFKSEGIVPLEEFDNIDEIKPGDEIEVYLETLESSDGQLTLSRRKADFIRIWEKLVEKYENDEIIPGTITRRIKGGMVVNLMGVDAFLPGSQIDVKPIRDFDAYLGKQMNFKIVKVNHARKNIVVSSRVLIEK